MVNKEMNKIKNETKEEKGFELRTERKRKELELRKEKEGLGGLEEDNAFVRLGAWLDEKVAPYRK